MKQEDNMMKKTLILSATVAAITVSFFMAPVAHASGTKRIGTFGAWEAYEFVENGNKVCYMASEPEDAKGDYNKRGEVFAMVTHRPAEGTKDVFSYVTGYTYKSGSDVTVKVNGRSFGLFTQDDTAWAPDAATDGQIVEAIRKGSKMVVKGTSSRGTLTTDTFSLKGSGAAHDAITKACGM